MHLKYITMLFNFVICLFPIHVGLDTVSTTVFALPIFYCIGVTFSAIDVLCEIRNFFLFCVFCLGEHEFKEIVTS